jgi:hypothetical protein
MVNANRITRILKDGGLILDSIGTAANNQIYAIALQDGKIVVVNFTLYNGL